MDNFVLNGVNGSQFNIGSYTEAEKGVDFGDDALFKTIYAEHPAMDGGVLAAEWSGVRKFKFPVILSSTVDYTGGLDGIQQTIRYLARPGATIDIRPDNVASANAVRFDVLAGRVVNQYDIYLQRAVRRRAVVELDVMPYGYLPTWIVLASAGSVGLPGSLAVPGGSVLGDVPALAEVHVGLTQPSTFPAGSYVPDMVGWSLGARASFQGFWSAGSIGIVASTNVLNASAITDAFAPDNKALLIYNATYTPSYSLFGAVTIPAALEPAYRGRFRVWAYAYGGLANWALIADAAIMPAAALASAKPYGVAYYGASVDSYPAGASPAYQIVDLGEVTLPPVGSGLTQSPQVRLWGYPITAATELRIGGVYLQPVDGPAGVMPRGLAVPSITSPSAGRLYLEAYSNRALVTSPTGDLGSTPAPMAQALSFYRGDQPYVGASTVQIDLIGGSRKAASFASTSQLDNAIMAGDSYAAVSVRYRPRFVFVRGI